MDSVPPQIYDSAIEASMFEFDNGKIKMNTDIDLNGHSINTPFFITGYYHKSQSYNRIFLNYLSSYQIIPFDCTLNEIVAYFGSEASNYQVSLWLYITGKSNINQTLNSTSNDRSQVFASGINLSKNDILMIKISKMNDISGENNT